MNNQLNPNDLRTYPVQEKPCKTCPFEGENPVQLHPSRYKELIENLTGQGQHLCHSIDKAFDQAMEEALNSGQ